MSNDNRNNDQDAMSWRNRHIVNVAHPYLPGMRLVGFVVSETSDLAYAHPDKVISSMIGEPLVHPDTERLNHLLVLDHETLSPADGDQASVESIQFIYDGLPGATKEAELRAALDSSIAALKKREGTQEWKRNDEGTMLCLMLVSIEAPIELIATWSDAQVQDAEQWAGAVHYHASDNDDVVVPPRPAFLDGLESP